MDFQHNLTRDTGLLSSLQSISSSDAELHTKLPHLRSALNRLAQQLQLAAAAAVGSQPVTPVSAAQLTVTQIVSIKEPGADSQTEQPVSRQAPCDRAAAAGTPAEAAKQHPNICKGSLVVSEQQQQQQQQQQQLVQAHTPPTPSKRQHRDASGHKQDQHKQQQQQQQQNQPRLSEHALGAPASASMVRPDQPPPKRHRAGDSSPMQQIGMPAQEHKQASLEEQQQPQAHAHAADAAELQQFVSDEGKSWLRQQQLQLQQDLKDQDAEVQRLTWKVQRYAAEHSIRHNGLRRLQRQLQWERSASFALHHHDDLQVWVDTHRDRFKQPPVGPIGAYLSLSDLTWADAAEIALGDVLDVWVADNRADKQVLVEAASTHLIDRIQVVVRRFSNSASSVSEGQRLQLDWRSLRDVVNISHPEERARQTIDSALIAQASYHLVVVDPCESRCFVAMTTREPGPKVIRAVHSSGLNYRRSGSVILGTYYKSQRQPRLGANAHCLRAATTDLGTAAYRAQKTESKLADTQQKLTAATEAMQKKQQEVERVEGLVKRVAQYVQEQELRRQQEREERRRRKQRQREEQQRRQQEQELRRQQEREEQQRQQEEQKRRQREQEERQRQQQEQEELRRKQELEEQQRQLQARIAAEQAAQRQRMRERLQQDIKAKITQIKQQEAARLVSEQTLANLQGHMHELESAKAARLVQFGSSARLRQLVNQHKHKFRQPPIGPVGAELALTDLRWACPAEMVLREVLDLWIVDNESDKQVLAAMAKEAEHYGGGIVRKFSSAQPYVTPADERLRPGWHSLRDFIVIDHLDPQARNVKTTSCMRSECGLVVVDECEARCRAAIQSAAAGPPVRLAVHTSGRTFRQGSGRTVMYGRCLQGGATKGMQVGDLVKDQEDKQRLQAELDQQQAQLDAANEELQLLQRRLRLLTHQQGTATAPGV